MNIHLRLANYISRYAPSRAKLIQYITKKKYLNPEELLSDIQYDEDMMMDLWMRTFSTLGKGEREIRMKLTKKRFPKELIIEKLENIYDSLREWSEYQSTVQQQIQTLVSRGKSTKIIEITLSGKYPYFRDEIRELLTENDESENLKKEIQKYKNKYNMQDQKDKQKLYAALMRKGYAYGDIKASLQENL